MKNRFLSLTAAFALLVSAHSSRSADHVDGPRASADPAADITDVFAWMSPDASRLNLVMDVVRNAPAGAQFSDAVRYTFRTESRPAFGAGAPRVSDVDCTFDVAQVITCRVGDATVSGDASAPSGITSADGRVRVFAGLRNDPFFFNLRGFRETARTVAAAAPSLTTDAAGCPSLDGATSAVLVQQLGTAPGGGPATNDFGGFNVLALVISIDKSLVTPGGPVVAVFGETARR